MEIKAYYLFRWSINSGFDFVQYILCTIDDRYRYPNEKKNEYPILRLQLLVAAVGHELFRTNKSKFSKRIQSLKSHRLKKPAYKTLGTSAIKVQCPLPPLFYLVS